MSNVCRREFIDPFSSLSFKLLLLVVCALLSSSHARVGQVNFYFDHMMAGVGCCNEKTSSESFTSDESNTFELFASLASEPSCPLSFGQSGAAVLRVDPRVSLAQYNVSWTSNNVSAIVLLGPGPSGPPLYSLSVPSDDVKETEGKIFFSRADILMALSGFMYVSLQTANCSQGILSGLVVCA